MNPRGPLNLPALPDVWRARVRRLPPQPPSWLAARALDRWLLPRLDSGQRRELADRVVEVEVLELGLRVRLRLGARGFHPVGDGESPTLRLRARADALWRLLRGEDDADRLFFERALVMEGDTEYGLILKNTLDAIGPLWPHLRGPVTPPV
ncbi:ubiquinone anaerobic biosynthesis accessory factor UbiT [Inhella gelatinilytica]|uniref:Ubiquinone biosynthesis accessory factor UbiT n=1 Tax=Inhella gelatinilytica TaxID=2795030 RepID=A0A931IUB0_9BURK|nr:SCP2 sterol-binding domain-containing protein [Inhella gelatinilytica]MBH9552087.1 SCP2 sterol-binding domain-containing protein [Inhella gelatinilytica]